VIRGDGRDLAALRSALTGADAVISLLPGGNRHDPHLAAETARALITTSAGLLDWPCAHTAPPPPPSLTSPRAPSWPGRRSTLPAPDTSRS
jgi:hypothetical protein